MHAGLDKHERTGRRAACGVEDGPAQRRGVKYMQRVVVPLPIVAAKDVDLPVVVRWVARARGCASHRVHNITNQQVPRTTPHTWNNDAFHRAPLPYLVAHEGGSVVLQRGHIRLRDRLHPAQHPCFLRPASPPRLPRLLLLLLASTCACGGESKKKQIGKGWGYVCGCHLNNQISAADVVIGSPVLPREMMSDACLKPEDAPQPIDRTRTQIMTPQRCWRPIQLFGRL